MHFLVPVLLSVVTGFLIVCLGWNRNAAFNADLLLKTSLGAGCGLGVFSIILFLSLVFRLSRLILIDWILLAFLVVLLWTRRRGSTEHKGIIGNSDTGRSTGWLPLVLWGGFALCLTGALYSSVIRVLANPHGAWDAFAIWNLHARFLFRGASNWKDGFSSLISWSHPDYPLLLPGAAAHIWTYLGRESARVPPFIALVFTFGTVGILYSGLSALRGRNQALLAGIVLLGTPSFIEEGTTQYADVPQSYFFLATLILLCLHDDEERRWLGLSVLAGLMSGLAAWTKNEGLLFLCAIVLARFLILLKRKDWNFLSRELIALLFGAFPILVVIAYFRIRIASADDLFPSASSAFHKVLEPARYWTVVRWYGKEFFQFGHWALIPGTVLLVGYYLLFRRERSIESSPAIRSSVMALGLTVAGYFGIYLISPHDLELHLRSSLNRLFLQVWPSLIFLLFMIVGSSEHPRSQHNGEFL